jgi:hypothetical protein
MRVVGNKEVRAAKAIASTMRVACNEEGDGNSNKGSGNKGGGQARVTKGMTTMWAMATGMRLVGNEEDKDKGSKSNGKGDVMVAGKEEDGG